MRRRFGQALRVGVADGSLALALAGRWSQPHVLGELHYDSAVAGSLAAALPQLLGAEYARWPVQFVLAHELVRMWSVTPPQTASRLADLQGAAALRFHALFGEMPSSWAVSGDWNATHPFMAAATPQALLGALEQAAAAQRMAIVGIEPHVAVAWNAARSAIRKRSWFGLVHGGVLTIGVPRGERLGVVRATGMPPAASADWLAAHVAREALLLGIDAPDALALSGAVPDNWLGGTSQLPCALAGPVSDPARSPAAQLALAGVAR